jgi:hypothetical protein
LVPLAHEILSRSSRSKASLAADDALRELFGPKTAVWIRRTEQAVRETLLSDKTRLGGSNIDGISAIAATFYVALFAVCRDLAKAYQSSNATWIRQVRDGERRAPQPRKKLNQRFVSLLSDLSAAVSEQRISKQEHGLIELRVADTTALSGYDGLVDLILTSPPYCWGQMMASCTLVAAV